MNAILRFNIQIEIRLLKSVSSLMLRFLYSGDDPLVGPLSKPQGDDTDGLEPEVAVDEDRLQARSDDEDT